MTTQTHTYDGTPFSITTEKKENAPGTWNSVKVTVFRDGVDIGGYERNYPSYAVETFYPFMIDGVWYALYSRDYTATRVARLTDKFEDWCGEERDACGFCPTEFWVPRYFTETYQYTINNQPRESQIETFENDGSPLDEFLKEAAAKNCEIKYIPHGYLSGCVWGDDTSWKLRFIDLSKIPEKQLVIDTRFGYWELPGNKLSECIHYSEVDHPWITITGTQAFNLNSKMFENDYREEKLTFWGKVLYRVKSMFAKYIAFKLYQTRR